MAPEVLERAALSSAAAAGAYRASAPYRAIEESFGGVAPDDLAAVEACASRLFAKHDWASQLIDPLIAGLHADPWIEPPFRVSRDALKIGAILFESSAVTITASILSGDALAALPPPRSVVVPGRVSLTRYVRAGGARLRLWRAEAIEGDFVACDAAPCRPLGSMPLADGAVVRFDGRTDAHLLAGACSDVVTLTATIRAASAPLMREFDIESGALLRTATLDDRAARAQILLTFLRVAGRRDAGDTFAAATRDPSFFLRWAAMREWLALDTAAALPRLRDMTGDGNREIRAAAVATLAMIQSTCPG